MPTKKTPAKTKADKESPKEVKKAKSKKAEAVAEAKPTAASLDLLPKIQCLSAGKKTVCANLILADHKCTAKRFPNGRLPTVRAGKKRRCEFYLESAYNG